MARDNRTLPNAGIEDRDEFLSKMKRTDKFIPVITVAVYYGEKPWDGATSLHEMLDIPKKDARQKAIQYSEEHNTDSSVIMTVAGATGSSIDLDKFEKGDMRMCSFAEEIRKEGRAEEIIESGYEFGLGESEILKRLQHKLNISMQAAQEYLCEYAK